MTFVAIEYCDHKTALCALCINDRHSTYNLPPSTTVLVPTVKLTSGSTITGADD